MFETNLGHYLTYHHVTQDFLRRDQEKFDGLIIPLSVATVFKQGTGGFVLTLGKPYALDPRTPIFQAEFARNKIKKAHLEMAAVHGPAIEKIFKTRPLEPGDLDKHIDDIASRVLEFQKTFSAESCEKVEKYAALLGEDVEEEYASPAFLIPPYFQSVTRHDPWYKTSLGLAKAAAARKENFRLAPVVHIERSFPDDQFKKVANDYDEEEFDGLIIFINNLKEYSTTANMLKRYVTLVLALRDTGKPLFGLFGGYFTLMLRKVGLGCFSNAIGYGEYRDSGYSSGGQAVRRYYIPKLHRYFPDTEAQSILDVVNEKWLRCQCPVCGGRKRITDLSSQQLLDHFLNARFSELIYSRDHDLETLLDELTETVARLKKLELPQVPIRDAHLVEWNDALRPYVEEEE
jgi:hypothetical protein